MQTFDEKQLRLDCTNLLCRAESHVATLYKQYVKHDIHQFMQTAKELMEELGEFGEQHFLPSDFAMTTEEIFGLLKSTMRLQEELQEPRFVSRWLKSESYPYARQKFRELYRAYVEFAGSFLRDCSQLVVVSLDSSTRAMFNEGASALVDEFLGRAES